MKSVIPVENVDGLKDILTSWLRDPCFDLVSLACDEGYTAYKKELELYSLQWHIKWENDFLAGLIQHKEQYDPVTRAFEMEKCRKNIAKWTDEIFEITGLKTMNYIK